MIVGIFLIEICVFKNFLKELFVFNELFVIFKKEKFYK